MKLAIVLDLQKNFPNKVSTFDNIDYRKVIKRLAKKRDLIIFTNFNLPFKIVLFQGKILPTSK